MPRLGVANRKVGVSNASVLRDSKAIIHASGHRVDSVLPCGTYVGVAVVTDSAVAPEVPCATAIVTVLSEDGASMMVTALVAALPRYSTMCVYFESSHRSRTRSPDIARRW